jgi:hypothetical protein
MTVILRIGDGAPWWESPDIWVVPGDDPLGIPGSPVAGQSAYVWARVHNDGDTDVDSARVDYWWANPATGVTRTTATLIGNAFVDVAAGTSEDVLCLVPWVPAFVNDGHECLVAEVNSDHDPLPTPVPDPFDPPNHRQTAQRNLSVLPAIQVMVLAVQIGIGPRERAEQAVLHVETGGELAPEVLETLGLGGRRSARRPLVDVALSHSNACGAEGASKLAVDVRPGATPGLYVHIRPAEDAKGDEQSYTVVRVFQDEPAGAGITYVVTAGR